MTDTGKNRLSFLGNGNDLFRIYIVNMLLSILSLGLYYPWSKAAFLKYVYQETEFATSRFIFHGTGKEMFRGFIKAMGIILFLIVIFIAGSFSKNTFLKAGSAFIFYLGFTLITPLAIHGRMRYRLSRTSWRGIHFGYRGDLKRIYRVYLLGLFVSAITLGIYTPWFINNLRKEVISNVRFGNVQFQYKGEGREFFVLYLKGIFFSVITCGIFLVWFLKNLHNYYINNIEIIQDGVGTRIYSTVQTGAYFENFFINYILTSATCGLGTPFAIVRNFNFIFSNIRIPNTFDPDKIIQTEQEYKDATAEDLSDMLDIGFA